MQIINLQLDGQNLLGVVWSTSLMGLLQRSGVGRGKCPKKFYVPSYFISTKSATNCVIF